METPETPPEAEWALPIDHDEFDEDDLVFFTNQEMEKNWKYLWMHVSWISISILCIYCSSKYCINIYSLSLTNSRIVFTMVPLQIILIELPNICFCVNDFSVKKLSKIFVGHYFVCWVATEESDLLRFRQLSDPSNEYFFCCVWIVYCLQ